MPFSQHNRITIHYQWWQSHRDHNIILINSLGTNLLLWSEVVPLIIRHFNVLLFDKRGHGLSSTQTGPLRIEDYADDVIHLMDKLGIQKAHVIGLSIGGLITYSLASRFPDRFEKLIFSNTGARLGTVEGWNERIQLIEKEGLAAASGAIIQRWLSAGYRKRNPAGTKGLSNMFQFNTTLGYVQACGAIRDADYNPVVAGIDHPAMFIGGSADEGTTPALVKENARNLGARRVEILEGVGHLPCVEAPAEVARLVIDFFLDDPALSLYEMGMRTRRSVLGDHYVDQAEAKKTTFDAEFQQYITENAWGSIWSRPGLTKRERSLITIALLTALGREDELALHLGATRHTGATEDDVKEVLLHTAIYAGVPATNGAMKTAKKVFSEWGKTENDK